MSCANRILNISLQNFRKWKTDYRIWMIAIVVLLLVHSYMSDVNRVADGLHVPQTLWNYPFLYAQFYQKLLFTLPLLFLFCDAPFLDANQLFVMVRSGRVQWCLGQLLYIIMTSAVYYLFLIVATILFSLFRAEWSLDWGTLLYTLAKTDASSIFDARFVVISLDVLNYFTPLQAMWFTFLVSWISGAFLGFLIFFCNMLLNSRTIGSIVGAALILLSAFLSNDAWNMTKWFSPFSWNTLNQIDIAGMTRNPPFWYCMTFYVVSMILCLILVLIKCRKMCIVPNKEDTT